MDTHNIDISSLYMRFIILSMLDNDAESGEITENTWSQADSERVIRRTACQFIFCSKKKLRLTQHWYENCCGLVGKASWAFISIVFKRNYTYQWTYPIFFNRPQIQINLEPRQVNHSATVAYERKSRYQSVYVVPGWYVKYSQGRIN